MRGFSRDSDDGLFPSRILPKEEIKRQKKFLGLVRSIWSIYMVLICESSN